MELQKCMELVRLVSIWELVAGVVLGKVSVSTWNQQASRFGSSQAVVGLTKCFLEKEMVKIWLNWMNDSTCSEHRRRWLTDLSSTIIIIKLVTNWNTQKCDCLPVHTILDAWMLKLRLPEDAGAAANLVIREMVIPWRVGCGSWQVCWLAPSTTTQHDPFQK